MTFRDKRVKAYRAYVRACDAADKRALANRPEHISDFNRRNDRIRALKAKYEAALDLENWARTNVAFQ